MTPIETGIHWLLLGLLLPAWIVVGCLDWWCHRQSGIAEHCGPWESVLHCLLLVEAGAAIMFGLLAEVNALVLAIMLICFVFHEITGYFDVRYAHARRQILPIEQKLHDYMVAIPAAALCLLTALHWTEVSDAVRQPALLLESPLDLKERPRPT